MGGRIPALQRKATWPFEMKQHDRDHCDRSATSANHIDGLVWLETGWAVDK